MITGAAVALRVIGSGFRGAVDVEAEITGAAVALPVIGSGLCGADDVEAEDSSEIESSSWLLVGV
ncbi:hypothetical protein WJ63_29865 [Burkholderia pyrrocinia]|nr:hypothetical protein WJ63_29865 [Burkholderia pyrrocinia]